MDTTVAGPPPDLTTTDLVVLLDPQGRPSGTAGRADVHTTDTPLHLAFSCYLLDDAGRILLTRRAVSKATWPGVWTNSFCGHPRPGEAIEAAVHRYADRELGTSIVDLACLLPDFRYRAVDPSGVVENELCPVYVARCDAELSPEPREVEELRWLTAEELARAVDAAPWALSPWLLAQIEQLRAGGRWPLGSR